MKPVIFSEDWTEKPNQSDLSQPMMSTLDIEIDGGTDGCNS